MPKRKSSRSREEDIDHYKNKIKKLEQKIRERKLSDSESEEEIVLQDDIGTDTPALRPDDWLLEWPDHNSSAICDPQPGTSASTNLPIEEPASNENQISELDTDILEILGEDLSSTEKYGPEVHNELASRLLHIAKEGLNKENRKELISKHLVPMNCAQICAPKINAEIKAAITDNYIKRDRGIEMKQKQMTSAIACLSEIINSQLSATPKNNILLQKLMDVIRILCDLQHADSITRRNFILFTLKKDMTDHLKNTKIDTYLFGENLAETLKSAKALNKSGVELKANTNNKTENMKYKGVAPKPPLNRRAPPQARRPPVGQAPMAPRSRGPAAMRAQYHPPLPTHRQPPHAHASRMSSQVHHTAYPRRQY